MKDTFLIVGLGNPGRRYKKTRHNVGFLVADGLADSLGTRFKKGVGVTEIAEVIQDESKIFIAKPQTFMNRSGFAVVQLLNFYRIALSNLLVISDDFQLPMGRIRLRGGGSSGGHNGLESIIDQLRTNRFARLRIGIGNGPENKVKFVLSRFSTAEFREMKKTIERAVDATGSFMRQGLEKTMTEYNA
jgi:PTH1 family peptidyl-tRNA hydrolase